MAIGRLNKATLLISHQHAKPNQAMKSRCEKALIRHSDANKRCGSLPIDRMPRHGQICLGVAKSDAPSRRILRIEDFIECLSTRQAELSQRGHRAG